MTSHAENPLRITPGRARLGLILTVLAGGVLAAAQSYGFLGGSRYPRSFLLLCASEFAYSAGFIISVQIAREYRSSPWMRTAWLCLAGNALVSAGRVAVSSPLLNTLWPGYAGGYFQGLIFQLAIVPSNALLLAALVCMWWAFKREGLGLTIAWRDAAVMSALLAVVAGIVVFRGQMTEAQSPFALARHLQSAGMVILGIAGAAAVVQYRFSVQMGDGCLASAMRYLAAYVSVRCVLVLVELMWRSFAPMPAALSSAFWVARLSVPWLFLLAAACRAQLTLDAARQLAGRKFFQRIATPSASSR